MSSLPGPGRRRPAGSLLRPLSLEGKVEGLLFAVACVLALTLIGLIDLSTTRGETVGSLAALPVLAAAWLLSRRLTVLITVLAMALRLVAILKGAVFLGTGLAQMFTEPLLALVGRVAAENLAHTQQQAQRQALVSRIARIATSSDRLNVILYGVLEAMAADGFSRGLVALMDERNELYPAAIEGEADRHRVEERLLAVAPLMTRAAAEGRSILIQDLGQDQAARARDLEYSVRSVVIVPLRTAGRVVGVLEFDDPERNRFDNDDVGMLESAALAVSGAVQRAGALQLADEQLRLRLKELGLLLETARTLSASLDLERILGEIVRSAADLISQAGRVSVRSSIFKVEGGVATFLAEYDEQGTRLLNSSFPLHQHRGLTLALETGRAATWDFAGAEEPLAGLVRRAGVHGAAFAPIRTGNEVFGVLSAASRDARQFEPEQLRLLEGIADLAGLAISNAQRLGLEMSRSQQLREFADRMQSLERTKSEFLRLASHELRGPVTILRGYISMLSDGTLGSLPEQTLRVLPMLRDKVTEMNHLIDQMLETARLEDTRLQLNLELVDLRQVLLDSVASLEGKAEAGGCRIVTQIDLRPTRRSDSTEPERLTVLADPARLGTIVTNLIDNAIKYSPSGGEISCRLTLDEALAQLVVADEGLGIDAADQARLFTRFGRIVTPENSHIPGTGLGLYLSRELARMHGGDISAESEKGEGSRFTLTLPVAMERLHHLSALEGDTAAGIEPEARPAAGDRYPGRA